jgi:ABC-type phosphate transport system permease subunit
MDERRGAGRVTLAGTDTTSDPVPDARAHDLSEEIVQPNIKSWRVHRVLSALYGLIALMLLALPYVARTGNEGLRSAEMAIAASVPLFFFALATLHHFVSRGAKERKRWARIGSIILACSLLPGVPVGTIIGVYLLRNSSWNRVYSERR